MFFVTFIFLVTSYFTNFFDKLFLVIAVLIFVINIIIIFCIPIVYITKNKELLNKIKHKPLWGYDLSSFLSLFLLVEISPAKSLEYNLTCCILFLAFISVNSFFKFIHKNY